MLKERSSKKRLPATEATKELTLDARHLQMVDGIQQKQALIEVHRRKLVDVEAQRETCRASIASMKSGGLIDTDAYNLAWSSNLSFGDALGDLAAAIHALETAQEEIEYYVNTGNILFEYYNLIERQEEVQANSSAATDVVAMPRSRTSRKKASAPLASRSILEALQIPLAPDDGVDGASVTTADDMSVDANDANDEPSDVAPARVMVDKQSLVEDYMMAIDPSFVRHPPSGALDNCQLCKVPLTCLLQEGIMVCSQCGYQELMLVEQNKPIHRQPSKETSHFSYKRINHFNELLSQLQGKESTEISDEVFERILAEILKERKDPSKITYNKMREILKKLRYNRYYEHCYYIIYRINGIPAPNFSQELEERLRSMFKEIQGPFLKHQPRSRKNFLSYSYCLFKLFQLLEKDDFLKYFHLLKSREKLHQQDQLWRKICEDLGWQFIESI
jgi:uncharacterized Zn finger protein (UPF0148 family)